MRATATGARLAALLLAWLAGVAVQLHERSLLRLSTYVGITALALLCMAASIRWRRRTGLAVSIAIVGAGLAGFGITGWQAERRLADALAPDLEGRDLVLTGVVASLPQ